MRFVDFWFLLQLVLEEVDVPYVLYVMEAEEFANAVGENTLHALITSTQARYPGFTICFLINKLKWYLNKKYVPLLDS